MRRIIRQSVLAMVASVAVGCIADVVEPTDGENVAEIPQELPTLTVINTSNYIHHYEFDQVSGTPSLPCGQAAYMVARHLVNASFPVSADELLNVHNSIKPLYPSSYTSPYYASVYQLQGLGDSQLGGSWAASYYSGSNRTTAKNYILTALQNGRPVLAPVEYQFQQGNIGHYLVIVGLYLTDAGTGSLVYYKDVASTSSQTFVVDYTTMLDSNKRNSCCGNYNLMWFN